MKKRSTIFLSLLLALTTALPALAENEVAKMALISANKPKSSTEVLVKASLPIESNSLKTDFIDTQKVIEIDCNTTIKNKKGSDKFSFQAPQQKLHRQYIEEDFGKFYTGSKTLACDNSTFVVNSKYISANTPWWKAKNIYTSSNAKGMAQFGGGTDATSGTIQIPGIADNSVVYVYLTAQNWSNFTAQLLVGFLDASGNVVGEVQTLDFYDNYTTHTMCFTVKLPGSGSGTYSLIMASTWSNTPFGLDYMEVTAYPLEDIATPGVPQPINEGYVIADDFNSFTTQFKKTTNAASYNAMVTREVTAKKDIASYDLINYDFSSCDGGGGTYGSPLISPYCFEETYLDFMPGVTLKWPVMVDGEIGFRSLPDVDNKLSGSWSGLVTSDFDLTATQGKATFSFSSYSTKSLLGVGIQVYNKKDNVYDLISENYFDPGTLSKSIDINVTNSNHDKSRVQILLVTSSTHSDTSQPTYLYIDEFKVTLKNIPAGSKWKEIYAAPESDLPSFKIDADLLGNDNVSYQYYFDMRGINYSDYNTMRVGNWLKGDENQYIPVELPAAPEKPVFKYYTKIGNDVIDITENTISLPYGSNINVSSAEGTLVGGSFTYTNDNAKTEFQNSATSSKPNEYNVSVTGSLVLTAQATKGALKSEEATLTVNVIMPTPVLSWDAAASEKIASGTELTDEKLTGDNWLPYIYSADPQVFQSLPATKAAKVQGTVKKEYADGTSETLAISTDKMNYQATAGSNGAIAKKYGKYTYTIHSVGYHGEVGEDVTYVLTYTQPQKVELQEINILFRESQETTWATPGSDGSYNVGDDKEKVLTIWYDGIDANSHDAAKGFAPSPQSVSYKELEDFYNGKNNTPKRSMAKVDDATDDAAKEAAYQAALNEAPVHLEVRVEYQNENGWKVVSPEYFYGYDWDWSNIEGERPPLDEFYMTTNDLYYTYPTAPGYISVPLLGKENKVIVTATANENVGTHKNPTDSPEGVPHVRTYSFATSPSTGVTDVEVDNDAPARYYNLQGIEVKNPSHGVYIKVQGNKSSKVSIR